MSAEFAALILAAGPSSRMGGFKPLLDLAGMTALERSVTLFRRAGVQDIRVVVGHRAGELAPHIRRLNVRAVPNPHYEEGMFSSVVCGVETLCEDVEAFFILPVDLPLVRPATVRLLLDAYRMKRCAVIYPSYRGARGHPPLIAGMLAPEIVRWEGRGGLQEVLAHCRQGAQEIAVADEQILRDMDNPDEYRALKARAERLNIPTDGECQALLYDVQRVAPQIASHGRAVAEVATELGRELNRAGTPIDVELLRAAALLHDIARSEPRHDLAGARLLSRWGYDSVAELVRAHMDIVVFMGAPVRDSEILYLADKLVQGEQRVSLAQCFALAKERYAQAPVVLTEVTRRLEAALEIQKRLEGVLGRPLAEVVQSV